MQLDAAYNELREGLFQTVFLFVSSKAERQQIFFRFALNVLDQDEQQIDSLCRGRDVDPFANLYSLGFASASAKPWLVAHKLQENTFEVRVVFRFKYSLPTFTVYQSGSLTLRQ